MGDTTNISWTDATFNPWIGCTKVAPGCQNCYAERDMDHRHGRVKWGPNGQRSRTTDANWRKPISWNKSHRRVFCASLCDVFESWSGPIVDHHGDRLWVSDQEPGRYCEEKGEYLPDEQANIDNGVFRPATMDDLRADLFRLIDKTHLLDWQLLTKRPENIRRMWQGRHRNNVWLGTSISDQATAERKIPALLENAGLGRHLFVSAEPLLGPIDVREWRGHIDWLILGGESGPAARPCDAQWIIDAVEQCRGTNTQVFVKQLGQNPVNLPKHPECLTDEWIKDRAGANPTEWPAQFRVQQFPVPF